MSEAADEQPAAGGTRETPNPYGELIAAEVTRAENDLQSMRARAVSLLTTVAGVVTLITGAVTFGASTAEAERGLPDAAIVLMGLGLVLILAAAFLALLVNAPTLVQNVDVDGLAGKTTVAGWGDGEDSFERERLVAESRVVYLSSIQTAVNDRVGPRLQWAVRLLIGGLLLIAGAAVWTAAAL